MTSSIPDISRHLKEVSPTPGRLRIFALPLAVVALLGSAFHFWPFEDNKLWQLLCPANLSVMLWVVIIIIYYIVSWNKQRVKTPVPHISVIAYVAVNILSLAFSPDLTRSLIFVVKLSLILFGAYSLLSCAINNERQLKHIYYMALFALLISLSYSLVVRFTLEQDTFGFHQNPCKNSTYLGMLAPLGCIFLFLNKGVLNKLLAAILVITSSISAGSIGMPLAIFTGISVPGIALVKGSVRYVILTALALAFILTALLWENPALNALRSDLTLYEHDGKNIKQRYIEWQAELNLLEDLTATGSGTGCINEYRSKFYYRLPKLNTLMPFDQNGWLAIPAENGILGLLCFCWIIVHYSKRSYQQIRQMKKSSSSEWLKYSIANMAGLLGACIAHLFSSVQYNGILLIFVVILVLIDKTESVLEQKP